MTANLALDSFWREEGGGESGDSDQMSPDIWRYSVNPVYLMGG